jgi:hypothetical protein
VYVVEKFSLSDFVLKIGQARVARALGAKPSSIAKAIRTGRAIVVTVADDGSCKGEETRPFPCQKTTQSDCEEQPDQEPGVALTKANGHQSA